MQAIFQQYNISSYLGVDNFVNSEDIINFIFVERIINSNDFYMFYFFTSNTTYSFDNNALGANFSLRHGYQLTFIKGDTSYPASFYKDTYCQLMDATSSPFLNYFSTFDLYRTNPNTIYLYDLGDYVGDNAYEEGYIPGPPIVYETPTLYIDDMNLRKRFSWQFNIPMVRDDTKYYVFLEDYKRLNYSSVTATFRIYTVTTPEGYDYTDYENYMYYDKRLKNTDLVIPAGCEIHEYSTVCNNGSVAELNEIQNYIAPRFHFTISTILNLQKLIAFTYDTFNEENFTSFYNYLYPTDFEFHSNISYSFSNFINQLLNTFSLDTIYNTAEDIFSNYFNNVSINNAHDYNYYGFLLLHYYSDFESYNFSNFHFSDFAFSNSSIVSYEPKHYDDNSFGYIYNIFRKTKVYNENNKISNNIYIFNYTDSEDVSSMLPEGTSVEYLTSPFYKDNENSSSGGYITYDVNEILQGDKVIDYSKEDNSIHNNFNGDYIENYTEGDNIVINNYYTNEIDKTSDEHLLHNIYLAILEIKLKLSDMGDHISNTTNNFTYNTENTIKYYFVPNSYAMDNIKQELEDTAEEHLGIIYQPFQRHTIYFYCYFWNSNK